MDIVRVLLRVQTSSSSSQSDVLGGVNALRRTNWPRVVVYWNDPVLMRWNVASESQRGKIDRRKREWGHTAVMIRKSDPDACPRPAHDCCYCDWAFIWIKFPIAFGIWLNLISMQAPITQPCRREEDNICMNIDLFSGNYKATCIYTVTHAMHRWPTRI